MRHRIAALLFLLTAAVSAPANAVYFPNGIDWTNPSPDRFVMSLYLNMLGRAPDNRDIRAAAAPIRSSDTRENRLRVFLQIEGSDEYQRLFSDSDRSWKIYQAPDYNYNAGQGFWRYQAAVSPPEGFEQASSRRAYSQQIARAIAQHYNGYCYRGQPCINNPQIAHNRVTNEISQPTPMAQAHACADSANHNSQFEWAATNGTTYPPGIDESTLCMGRHYYETAELKLLRYQCDPGYLNCRRDPSKDLRGQRSGKDSQGHPAIFFSDGSRLSLTSSTTYNAPENSNAPLSQSGAQPTGNTHACADTQRTTSRYQWKSRTGTSIARGIDNSVVCMNNFYYVVEGISLARYQCAEGFSSCKRQQSGDIRAQRRVRVDGSPGLEFSNGTTLALIKRGTTSSITNATNNSDDSLLQPQVQRQPTQTRQTGGHNCADPSLRISQFRWTRKNGATTWPDGIDGRVVCQSNAYYVIEGVTLRHHQCGTNFTSCRANPRNDLIALQDGEDRGGYRTLVFANGDQLSLISR